MSHKKDRRPIWKVVRRFPGFDDPDRRPFGVSVAKKPLFASEVESGLTRGEARAVVRGLNAAAEVLSS